MRPRESDCAIARRAPRSVRERLAQPLDLEKLPGSLAGRRVRESRTAIVVVAAAADSVARLQPSSRKRARLAAFVCVWAPPGGLSLHSAQVGRAKVSQRTTAAARGAPQLQLAPIVLSRPGGLAEVRACWRAGACLVEVQQASERAFASGELVVGCQLKLAAQVALSPIERVWPIVCQAAASQ